MNYSKSNTYSNSVNVNGFTISGSYGSICDVPIKTGQEILAKNGFYECKKCYDLFLITMGNKDE